MLDAREGAWETDCERVVSGVLWRDRCEDSRVNSTVAGGAGKSNGTSSSVDGATTTADGTAFFALVFPTFFACSYRARYHSIFVGRGFGKFVGVKVGSTYVEGSDAMRKEAYPRYVAIQWSVTILNALEHRTFFSLQELQYDLDRGLKMQARLNLRHLSHGRSWGLSDGGDIVRGGPATHMFNEFRNYWLFLQIIEHQPGRRRLLSLHVVRP